MILIAHRGNISGPNHERENHPDYILNAINAGYDVEIDLWYAPTYPGDENPYYLGHDEPQYKIDFGFLVDHCEHLWVHCKSFETLESLASVSYTSVINYFYHTDEDYVLTRHGYVWAYPGKVAYGRNTICVMPELDNYKIGDVGGVCSDYVEMYK
jgi:hypothetical protein